MMPRDKSHRERRRGGIDISTKGNPTVPSPLELDEIIEDWLMIKLPKKRVEPKTEKQKRRSAKS